MIFIVSRHCAAKKSDIQVKYDFILFLYFFWLQKTFRGDLTKRSEEEVLKKRKEEETLKMRSGEEAQSCSSDEMSDRCRTGVSRSRESIHGCLCFNVRCRYRVDRNSVNN